MYIVLNIAIYPFDALLQFYCGPNFPCLDHYVNRKSRDGLKMMAPRREKAVTDRWTVV